MRIEAPDRRNERQKAEESLELRIALRHSAEGSALTEHHFAVLVLALKHVAEQFGFASRRAVAFACFFGVLTRRAGLGFALLSGLLCV